MKRIIPVAAALLLLAGCTADEGDPQPSPATAGSPPPWTEPANYSFVADRTCDGTTSTGKFRITVAGGEIAKTERTDGKATQGEEEVEVPTLGGMVELAQTAIDDGADATMSFDPADGHPIAVVVNRAEEENGGATCFKVSEYAPGP
ncbi:DUF6174 domain-containing protein [Actinoplanes sp. NPDC051470]|uniref:DUF6174 domain-containing protein n=1 Tax=Actinoplanes sp. NPDC051470 TaxID=3157224 RepID=UPI0034326FDC